jgi:hypothetical protein
VLLDKHAAVGSVAIPSGQVGRATDRAALVAERQTGKAKRIALSKTGSTYTGTLSPLLTGLRNPLAPLLARNGPVVLGDWLASAPMR